MQGSVESIDFEIVKIPVVIVPISLFPAPEMRPVSVGILSIGEMGLGVAKLLKSHDYRVLTVANNRRRVCTYAHRLDGCGLMPTRLK